MLIAIQKLKEKANKIAAHILKADEASLSLPADAIRAPQRRNDRKLQSRSFRWARHLPEHFLNLTPKASRV